MKTFPFSGLTALGRLVFPGPVVVYPLLLWWPQKLLQFCWLSNKQTPAKFQWLSDSWIAPLLTMSGLSIAEQPRLDASRTRWLLELQWSIFFPRVVFLFLFFNKHFHRYTSHKVVVQNPALTPPLLLMLVCLVRKSWHFPYYLAAGNTLENTIEDL